MARTPHTPAAGIEQLGVSGTVLLAGPPPGWAEAVADLDESRVLLAEATAEVEARDTITTAADTDTAPVVVVWAGPIAPNDVRNWTSRVVDGGAMWVILPKRDSKGGHTQVSEADLKRGLLIRGWRDDRTVATGPDSYGIRFRQRR